MTKQAVGIPDGAETPFSEFERDCKVAISSLQAAMIALFDDVGLDPGAPQEAARHLGVNKTLTWNLSRLMSAADGMAAVQHMPGTSSLDKVLKAAEVRGASRAALEKVQDAAARFDEMMKSHAGDRPTMDLIIDGLAPGQVDALGLSRKLAFRGNSGLYGVQARTRLHACFLMPNAENDSLLDMATVSGFVSFRRLRAGVRWPLFTIRAWGDDDDAMRDQWDPIDAVDAPEGSERTIMRRFMRGSAPRIESVSTKEGQTIVLDEGPLGNNGAFDCFRGEMKRAAASRYATREDDTGDLGPNITAPCENLVFDIIAHRDLEFALRPEVEVFASILNHGEASPTELQTNRLPISLTARELPGTPPQFRTPLVPEYQEIAHHVISRLGGDPKMFRAIRIEMDFPPLGSTVLARLRLPHRSA